MSAWTERDAAVNFISAIFSGCVWREINWTLFWSNTIVYNWRALERLDMFWTIKWRVCVCLLVGFEIRVAIYVRCGWLGGKPKCAPKQTPMLSLRTLKTHTDKTFKELFFCCCCCCKVQVCLRSQVHSSHLFLFFF